MSKTLQLHNLALFVLLAAPILSLAQTTNVPAQAQSAVIRVTSPQPQRQTVNYVIVRYALQNPTSAPAGSPNFQVQLDDNDPITMATTEQTFTGLAPGRHVVTVQLVDANGTQIPNSQTQVEFVVLPTSQNGGTAGKNPGNTGGQTATPAPQAQSKSPAGQPQIQEATSLPEAGSFMPVLSIIGFGVLFGGIVSALKTRH